MERSDRLIRCCKSILTYVWYLHREYTQQIETDEMFQLLENYQSSSEGKNQIHWCALLNWCIFWQSELKLSNLENKGTFTKGFISKEDFKWAVRELLPEAKYENLERIFDEIDSNKDCKVTYKDFIDMINFKP